MYPAVYLLTYIRKKKNDMRLEEIHYLSSIRFCTADTGHISTNISKRFFQLTIRIPNRINKQKTIKQPHAAFIAPASFEVHSEEK